MLAAVVLLVSACGRGEIKGTYDVEIEIPEATRALRGVLVLSNRPLDIPSSAQGDGTAEMTQIVGDTAAANSCFILEPGGSGPDDPGVVRVFEARIDPGAVRVPIEILNTPDLRIEVTRLEFFGQATGGELEVHTRRGPRPGRLFGTRAGPAAPERCVESVAAFRRFLQALAAEAP